MTFGNRITSVDLLSELNQSTYDSADNIVEYRVEDDLMFVVGECVLNSVLDFVDTKLEDYEFTA
jgi:hypothetical protein